MMIEEAKIRLSAELNSKGLDELRKKLNESRNELNKLARQQEKGSAEHRKYKAEVKEINRVLRLSDVELTRLQRSLQKEEKAAKDATEETKKLNEETKKLNEEIGDTSNSVSGLSDVMKVGITAGVTYLASQLGNLIGTLKESALAGAEFENLYNSFVKVNGGIDEANSKLELLRKASAGNLDDGALIEFTNEMNSLGFATEEAAKLLDIAEVMGDNLGKTFEQSTNAFKTFIITGQGRSLKEIGINIKEVEAKMLEYAGATQEQIDGLSELDQQQLRSSFVLDTYGRSITDINGKLKGTDDKLASIETVTKNVSNLIGVTLANAFEEVSKETGAFNQELDVTIQDAIQLGKDVGNVINTMVAWGARIQEVSNYLSPVAGIIRNIYNPVKDLTDELFRLIGILPQLQETQKQSEDVANRIFGNNPNLVGEDEMFPSKGEFERRKKFNFQSNKSGTSGNNSAKEKEVKITNDLIRKQEELNELLKVESTFTADQKNQQAYLKYLEDVKKLKAEIAFLQSEQILFDTAGVTLPNRRTGLLTAEQIRLSQLQAESDMRMGDEPEAETESAKNNLIEGVQTVSDEILSTMNIFGDGVSKGIRDFLNGLTIAVQLIKTLQTVNSILGLIPGFASGGSFPGGSPIMVGEKGAEIIFPRNAGFVMNNNDSKKFLNQNMTRQQDVNVYINANLDGLTFLRKNFPNYQNFKKGNRIN